MARTITVKGVGRAMVRPDQIVLHINMEAREKTYEGVMASAFEQLADLRKMLDIAGFDREDCKNGDLSVRTDYDRKKDEDGNYVSVFSAYVCTHDAKLTFRCDNRRLADAMRAISRSLAKPTVTIDYTVQNPAAVNALVLADAARNARSKAQILCQASGVHMGKLQSISYDWNDVTFFSDTKYSTEAYLLPKYCETAEIDIDPEDIVACENVTFVWEIQ